MNGAPRTLLDRLWEQHRVKQLPGGEDLLHVDRFCLHDLTGIVAIPELMDHGRSPLAPGLNFAVTDHAVSSAPDRADRRDERYRKFVEGMREQARRAGLRHFDIGDAGQGIVHVIGPELGLTLPGATFLCTDSHTCTHGALGALAWGIGSTDAGHVLATQTIVQRKPRAMRLSVDGALPPGVTAKDLILAVIKRFGAGFGNGYAIEFAGPAIDASAVEERLTLCNMTVELGARIGFIAPDERVFSYLQGRPFAPAGESWDRALAHWRGLRSDDDAEFDREAAYDASSLKPQVSWGTSVDQSVDIDGIVPTPEGKDEERRAADEALDYMGLRPGDRLAGLRIGHAFIGSCTNGRLTDLKAAAAVIGGRRVAPHVRAWVVPGSTAVKRAAEAEGLDRIFREAGFEWRESACSLCSAVNGETVPPGERAISSTNRNFVGRQGPGARTHLASPATVAASAIEGRIADPRELAR
jgi:3-isopropylmalate/(R)-2-methylmalate dehydratase large subunit